MTEPTARERFEVQTAAATRNIEKLQNILDVARKGFEDDDRNWGYVGDIARINELLDRAVAQDIFDGIGEPS